MPTLHLSHNVSAAASTAWADDSHVPEVAAMFGIGAEPRDRAVVIPPITLDLAPHRIVFVTGPSGGGKSTLLRLIATAPGSDGPGSRSASDITPASGPRVLRLEDLPAPPDRALVDGFPGVGLDGVLRTLSVAGLNDACVLMRRPNQLSDGQRARLQLAHALHHAAAGAILLADEFTATLDRLTARVIPRNVRKWVDRVPICFVAATTHDDLLDALDPDVLIEKGLGDAVEVARRGARRMTNVQ